MTTGLGFHRALRVFGLKGIALTIVLVSATVTAEVRVGAVSPTAARPSVVAAAQAQVLLRTGDRAPIEARVPDSFSGTLGYLPDGRLTFIAGTEYALEVVEAGQARILLHVGDRIAGCGTVSNIYYHSAGGGSIAALVQCTLGQAIVRIDPDDGSAAVALSAGTIVANPRGTAVDGEGRIVAAVDTGPGTGAIVRLADGAAPEILIQTGDPLGGGTFVAALREPSVSAGGTVAFSATTSLGTEVIATLTPGGTPTVLFSVPIVGPPGFAPQPLGLAPPVLNDSGVVAFLWGDPDHIVVQRAVGGAVDTVAEAGDPAPGGGTFTAINWVYPAVDASGGVIFGAERSNGLTGLYRFDVQATRVAEQLDDTGNGEHLVQVGDWSMTPLPCADGALRFVAVDSVGSALFDSREGVVTVDLRAGAPMLEPARFVRFEQSASVLNPYLSAGPFMAPGGAVIIDAVASGRGRGLYVRAADGTLAAVAIDGDPAPGGGHFDGAYFAFHSIEAGGRVAFLGAAPDGPRESVLQLFTGRAGSPLERVLGGGDSVPGFESPITSLLPPSRINSAGAVVVPAILSDGRMLLLGWDGTTLTRIAASGDTLPDNEVIASFQTGQPQALLPPLLDDAGGIVFGVTTESGHAALYRTTLSVGVGSAVRVLGDGDLVQGGVLEPFLLQALAADRSGRIAFQAVPSPGPNAATYSTYVGPIPRLVIDWPPPSEPPSTTPPGPGVPPDVALPRLAASAAGGVVHEATGGNLGKRLLFAIPRFPTAPNPATAYDQTVLVGLNVASPDGGVFLRANAGVGPIPGPIHGRPPQTAMRLGSDGDRYVVAVEPTSVNPEILVLFDLRPNQPPIADAGPDRTIECTGPEGAAVTLDARASYDPENGALEYAWTGPFGTASGPTPTVTLSLGTWTIDLGVRDAEGAVTTDTVVVTVRDTVAAAISVSAVPDSLWPPNGSLRPVSFVVGARDLCDPQPSVVLASIASNDPTTDPASDIVDAAYGTDDRAVLLRARRGRGTNGRLYTATYLVADRSGNQATAAATVLVPQH